MQIFKLTKQLCLMTFTFLFMSTSVLAVDVMLDAERDSVDVIHNNGVIKVKRIQDTDHKITGGFTKTSRKCPPFCIQPMVPVPGVKPVSEIDIFNLMENELVSGDGLLIDARTPAWHQKGTIPGSINIPFTVFEADINEPALQDALKKMGVRKRGSVSGFVRTLEKSGFLNGDMKNDVWDFSRTKKVIIWCNGPWCGQSPRAIKALVELGYPAEKIQYYRGGMQTWQILGLTTVKP
ncbi:MAG TPA: rhodanese-like domain-containing protein [Chromatiales bacterium]|nr:rhodanese-like domain-containing protein [Thiotrichales bacterium]HIP67840.1 rhodanese-like domain-containing protein [Chromatiales bacterium]